MKTLPVFSTFKLCRNCSGSTSFLSVCLEVIVDSLTQDAPNPKKIKIK